MTTQEHYSDASRAVNAVQRTCCGDSPVEQPTDSRAASGVPGRDVGGYPPSPTLQGATRALAALEAQPSVTPGRLLRRFVDEWLAEKQARPIGMIMWKNEGPVVPFSGAWAAQIVYPVFRKEGEVPVDRAGSPPWRTTAASPAPGTTSSVGSSSTRPARPKSSSSGGGRTTTPCGPTAPRAIGPRPPRRAHSPCLPPSSSLRWHSEPAWTQRLRPDHSVGPGQRRTGMPSVPEPASPRRKRQPPRPQVRSAPSAHLRTSPRHFGGFVADHPEAGHTSVDPTR